MTQNPYKQLAARLDALPNGFPATESGVELRLLAALLAPMDDALQNANAPLWQQGMVGLVLLLSLWLALNPGVITAVAATLSP